MFPINPTTINDLLNHRITRYGITFLVLGGFVSTIVYSFNPNSIYRYFLLSITYLSAFVFTIEYGLRIIASRVVFPSKYCVVSCFRYLFSFFGIIDLIVILPFTLPFFVDDSLHIFFDLSKIFLVFKIARYSDAFMSIVRVFNSVRKELAAIYFTILILICFFAVLMFYVENEAQPEAFRDIGQGFWWSVITFTSVGYGDIFPVTVLGKLLGGIVALLGVLLFAIPTGIVSSAFMNSHQQNNLAQSQAHQKKTSHCPHCGKSIDQE